MPATALTTKRLPRSDTNAVPTLLLTVLGDMGPLSGALRMATGNGTLDH
jgi:hypothetical protein